MLHLSQPHRAGAALLAVFASSLACAIPEGPSSALRPCYSEGNASSSLQGQRVAPSYSKAPARQACEVIVRIARKWLITTCVHFFQYEDALYVT